MITGIRYYENKRYQKALEEFLKQDVEEGEYPTLAYYLALTYTKLDRHDEALLYFEQVITSSNNKRHTFNSKMIMGYIYDNIGKIKLAENEFKKILESNIEIINEHPSNKSTILSALGHLLYKQNKIEDSLEYLNEALKLNPSNEGALNSIGYIKSEISNNKSDLEDALIYCKKALKQQPQNPTYLDSVAWIHHKLGNSTDAVLLIERAYEANPKDKDIKKHYKKIMDIEE